MFQNRFDEFYMTICRETGGIEGLLKSFFDFMIRKTDFFYECDPGDKMGFPPGYNRKLLLGIFQQFQKEHYKRFPQKSIQQFERKMKEYQTKKNKSQKKQQPKTDQKVQEKPTEKKQIKIESNEPSIQQKNKTVEKVKELSQKQQTLNKQDILNTYNGGKTDKYSWSQQSNDVEVSIQLSNDTTAKMLQVNIQTNSISVKKKTGQTIIEGQLYQKINSAQSVWKVQQNYGKNFLTFNLQKAQDKIWSTIFKGDPQIDTTKVNNTKKLQEFDGQTQGAIRKIMYQQQRKQMGLPTTDQQKQIDALKKAWDAEGSPFKGQPFDPSKINLSGSDFHPQ